MNRLKLALPYLLLLLIAAEVMISGQHRDSLTSAASTPPSTAEKASTGGAGQPFIDVVCHMEVDPAWGYRADHGGNAYYFCAMRCKRKFTAAAEAFLTTRCLVCQTPLAEPPPFAATYMNKTYPLCSETHRIEFKLDPAAYFMHRMWGIPSWLYYTSIALVLVLSFGIFEWLSRRGQKSERHDSATVISVPPADAHSENAPYAVADRTMSAGISAAASGIALPILSMPAGIALSPGPSRRSHAAVKPRTRHRRPVGVAASTGDRLDLLAVGWIRAALTSRVFRFGLQAFFVAAFLLIIAAGLFGNQNPSLNVAPILTWTLWWALLIVLILFFAKAWCYVCPWDAIAGWLEKLAFWKKTAGGLSLNLTWPKALRNIYLATFLFVGLTWIELGFGVTMKPRVTAYLAIAMLLMTVLSALVFDRKSFCRYGCLVGRVSGLYAMFAGTEVRARKPDLCNRCHTKECVKGSDTAYGCPTFLYPGKLQSNTYCIQCLECIQACPHDNLAVNLRPWGSDLILEGKPRTDEAYLALLMLSLTGFHGLTMTPIWQQFITLIRDTLGAGRVFAFSLAMAALMLAPIAIYAVLVAISKGRTEMNKSASPDLKVESPSSGAGALRRPLTYHDYFVRYAYALLPIALFYHIAHNLEHLLMEGPKILAMISDPFGWNWDLFGTAAWTIPPMISLDRLWLIQVFLVLLGHVYSLWIAQKTSARLFRSSRTAFRSQLPMLLGMICFSVFSLWLLKQPMEMRTSAM